MSAAHREEQTQARSLTRDYDLYGAESPEDLRRLKQRAAQQLVDEYSERLRSLRGESERRQWVADRRALQEERIALAVSDLTVLRDALLASESSLSDLSDGAGKADLNFTAGVTPGLETPSDVDPEEDTQEVQIPDDAAPGKEKACMNETAATPTREHRQCDVALPPAEEAPLSLTQDLGGTRHSTSMDGNQSHPFAMTAEEHEHAGGGSEEGASSGSLVPPGIHYTVDAGLPVLPPGVPPGDEGGGGQAHHDSLVERPAPLPRPSADEQLRCGDGGEEVCAGEISRSRSSSKQVSTLQAALRFADFDVAAAQQLLSENDCAEVSPGVLGSEPLQANNLCLQARLAQPLNECASMSS